MNMDYGIFGKLFDFNFFSTSVYKYYNRVYFLFTEIMDVCSVQMDNLWSSVQMEIINTVGICSIQMDNLWSSVQMDDLG